MRIASSLLVARSLTLLGGLALSLAAHAALVSPVTVQLLAPGGTSADSTAISATELAPVASGVSPGSGDVGAGMLDDEFIQFDGNSIKLRLEAGDDTGGVFRTGYFGNGSGPAQYLFSNLSISGFVITGVVASAYDNFANSGSSGLQGPATAQDFVQLVNPSTISFALEDLLFVASHQFNGGYRYMDIRLDLLTRPDGGNGIPEPASLALVLLGLALLGRGRNAPRP